MTDLLDNYDNLPKNVKSIFSTYDHNQEDYRQCSKIEKELNKIGYSIEWGLDASFYNLRKVIK